MKLVFIGMCLLVSSSLSAQSDTLKRLSPDESSQKGSTEGLSIIGLSEGEVYTYIEERPLFPGGERAMLTFIADSLVYPQKAIREKIQGKVYVQCDIDTAGNVTNIKIAKSPNALLDQAALNVVKAMPLWRPGRINEKITRARIIIPVIFVLP